MSQHTAPDPLFPPPSPGPRRWARLRRLGVPPKRVVVWSMLSSGPIAVLREGVDIADARRQFERFGGFYQGDAVNTLPHFKAPAPRPLPVELPAGQAASA